MGTNLSKTKLAPPKIIDQVRSEELASLIRRLLRPDYLRIVDHIYDIYSLVDLRRFLDVAVPWAHFLPDGNSALQLIGRERVWFAGADPSGFGSTFGYIVGDIRLPEEPYIQRVCSANFFLDQDRQIWIIDPKTGRVYQPTLQTRIEIVLI